MRRRKTERVAWHAYIRGARRLGLFYDDLDFLQFFTILAAAVNAAGCLLLHYTLMPNHFHLVIVASSAELTKCMRRLDRVYSRFHNKRHGLSGHAFDGPYVRHEQWSFSWLVNTIAYVALNPVEAKMVLRPEDYKWSSYRDYLGLPGSPLKVDVNYVLGRLGATPEEARVAFLAAVQEEMRHPRPKPTNGLKACEVQSHQFDWLLRQAKSNQALLRGEDPTLVAMYWASQRGIPLRAMLLALGLPASHSLRRRFSRFRRRIGSDPLHAARLAPP